MRGATQLLVSAGRGIIISIHAPREGSDEGGGGHVRISRVFQSTLPVRGATQAGYYGILYTYISIHAPREGSDWRTTPPHLSPFTFQSTLPVRGATFTIPLKPVTKKFQSTLPVRGATTTLTQSFPGIWISIHAPREGSDDLYL
mgnify:CR=1 FL=1